MHLTKTQLVCNISHTDITITITNLKQKKFLKIIKNLVKTKLIERKKKIILNATLDILNFTMNGAKKKNKITPRRRSTGQALSRKKTHK